MRTVKIVGSGKFAGRTFYGYPVCRDMFDDEKILIELDELALSAVEQHKSLFNGHYTQSFSFSLVTGMLCVKDDQCDLFRVIASDLHQLREFGV